MIDECVSVGLVTVAAQCGQKHGTLRIFRRAGWRDWNVARNASDRDLILVTNNASDFRAALDELAAIGEPVNGVLEVDLDAIAMR